MVVHQAQGNFKYVAADSERQAPRGLAGVSLL